MNIPGKDKMTTETTNAGIRGLANRKMTKDVDFMGTKLKISKLSVAEMKQVQEIAKLPEAAEGEDAPVMTEAQSLKVLQTVIQCGAEGGAEMTAEEFESMPIDELSKLSEAIMAFSGMGSKK